MGKSLWLSLLSSYYDIRRKNEFDQLFAGTAIHQNPTSEQNSYLILKFNFSLINPDPKLVEESFEQYGKAVFETFLAWYQDFFSEEVAQNLMSIPRTSDRLNKLFMYTAQNQLKLYLLIDEYDNFTNTIMSTVGKKEYHGVTSGAGFYRYFFNILKGGTGEIDQGNIRLFITGVSPITMDDVTSGFNIGSHVSLDEDLNEIMGFTEEEVTKMLRYYREATDFPFETETLLPLLKEWYDGYRFSSFAEQDIFHTDMVLYFLNHLLQKKRFPQDLIDRNVRMDYGKLRHLITIDQRLNENFSRLQKILEEEKIRAQQVATGFPLEELLNPNNFYSLLYYFGLLTFGEKTSSKPSSFLKIPNRTILHLMYGYIRSAYQDVNCFQLDLWDFANKIEQMAYEGEWKEVFQVLSEEVERQTSIRDYLSNEKMVQGFLLAYLNVADYFLTHSEIEVGKGYADFFLEPFWGKYSDIGYTYLIELKYCKRAEKFTETVQNNLLQEARAQLLQYAQDPKFQQRIQKAKLIKLAIVFHGWELIIVEKIQ